ncbi:toprim domain-containing protein [Methanolobus sp. ZRKC2]|uniref:toprim domain-containing protein n=1 Tax=Methanolobus sp. ZRKC2 TaxID=3125783 RepID=UPI00325410A0
MFKSRRDHRSLKAPLYVYQKRLESIEEIIDELLQLAEEGNVIIVEGKRDVRALNKLGINGHFEMATHHSLSNFCEDITNTGKGIIILTDWDRRGNMLMSNLVNHFHSLGVNPDVRIRERLKSIVQKEIKDVESLPTYVLKLRHIAGSSTY